MDEEKEGEEEEWEVARYTGFWIEPREGGLLNVMLSILHLTHSLITLSKNGDWNSCRSSERTAIRSAVRNRKPQSRTAGSILTALCTQHHLKTKQNARHMLQLLQHAIKVG
jgi:hypothetical protein